MKKLLVLFLVLVPSVSFANSKFIDMGNGSYINSNTIDMLVLGTDGKCDVQFEDRGTKKRLTYNTTCEQFLKEAGLDYSIYSKQ